MTPAAALTDILTTIDVGGGSSISFSGAEPQLPSPIRLATAGAAALGAVGTAVDALWRLKGGTQQEISVEMKHAAAAVRSNELIVRNGECVTELWYGPSGFMPCRNGRWIRFHCNFPLHEQAVRRVLDVGPEATNDDIRGVTSNWDALALEDAVLDAGGCAYMVRSTDEWATHPQSSVIAGLPVLEIIKIGDAPAKPLPAGARPLSGIRTLELTRVIAGPVIGRTLAEHGADVMRVASPHLPFIAPLIIDTGHGKLSTHIDLETEAGVATFRNLLADADVITQGYRPGTIADRGFGPEDIARDFPGTVYVTLSAWSHAGPWADRRGFDSLVQCATGWAVELGGPDRPKLQPAQAIDYVTGFLGAFGAMEALRRRALEGGTWLVRLSLAQTAQWVTSLGRNTGDDIQGLHITAPSDVPEIMTESETPFGPVQHLGPAISFSETNPGWTRPAVPLGTHPPVWPDAAV